MAALLCPLCSQSRFDNLESLRMRLVSAATQNITCPICNEALLGLDKFTIHLFGHTLTQEATQPTPPPQKEEVAADPLCTVNMEDLNFLTSWEVCCKNESNAERKSERSIEVSGRNPMFTEATQHVTSFEKNSGSEVCQTKALIEESSTLKFQIQPYPQNLQGVRRNTEPDVSQQQKLNLEIHPNLIKIERHSFETDTLSLRLQENDNLNGISGNPVNIEFNSKNMAVVPEPGTDTSYDSPDISSGFLSTLTELREPALVLSQSSSPICLLDSSDIQKIDSSEEMLPMRYTTEKPEALQAPRTISLATSPRRKSEESSLENRELSEYMSELLKQKMPASNFLFSLPKAKKPVLCDQCGAKMESAKILAAHKELVHSTPDPYLCRLCGRGFKMRGSLLVHTRVAHGSVANDLSGDQSGEEVRNFHCCICTKSFKKEQHLTQHLKTHDGKQWQCETCSKFFTTKYFLKKHQRLHTGEMPYSCETCKKTFTFQQSYHKHLLYHSADKPHECQECGRAFKELSTLHNHQRIHSGEKPFSCETCGKCFRQRVSYIVHQRIHTGVLPYQCTACKKKFRYKVSQRSHKCTAQPPGIVVRQPGDLIQRILEHRQNILQCLE